MFDITADILGYSMMQIYWATLHQQIQTISHLSLPMQNIQVLLKSLSTFPILSPFLPSFPAPIALTLLVIITQFPIRKSLTSSNMFFPIKHFRRYLIPWNREGLHKFPSFNKHLSSYCFPSMLPPILQAKIHHFIST